MKAALYVTIAIVLGLLFWLFVLHPDEGEMMADATLSEHPIYRFSRGPTNVPQAPPETEDLRARVAELEKEVAEAKASASDTADIDPLGLILYSRKPLGWRVRKILEIEPEKDRWMAAWKLGLALGEKEGSAREILETLKTETDPKVLNILAQMLRSGAANKAPPEDRRAFGELLRTSTSPEVRTVCVRGLFMSEYFRGGFDETTKATAAEMNGILNQALKTESSGDVVGAIAESYSAWFPPPEAMEALREAAARLPAGPGRRQVWEAIGRGSFLADQGASLFQQFREATSRDVRDDIAAGLARAGNSMGGAHGGSFEEARARFRVVYEGTSDVAVRRSLVRAATQGMNCVGAPIQTDEQKTDAGRFFRGVAALEPDLPLRERIERLAAAFETRGDAAYADIDRILSGKE
jgi:hypothetical protein